MDKLKKILTSYIFDGIVLILIGIAVIIWSELALDILFRVIGAVFAVLGIVKLIMFFVNKNNDRKATDLLTALLQIVLGAALLIKPDFFVKYLFIIIGVIMVYGSILMLIRAVKLRREKGAMFVLSLVFGILTLVLGAVIIWNPAAFANFIMILYGISLIIEGLAMLIVLSKITSI